MNNRIAELLNDPINKKFYSAYLYLDMANYYDEMNLDGYANYYMIQAQEERDHALLFMKYMQNNGLKVTLDAIGKPDKEFKEVLDTKGGFVLAHWDGTPETEVAIKDATKATIRCIPFDAPEEEGVCVFTGKPSHRRVLFARSY